MIDLTLHDARRCRRAAVPGTGPLAATSLPFGLRLPPGIARRLCRDRLAQGAPALDNRRAKSGDQRQPGARAAAGRDRTQRPV